MALHKLAAKKQNKIIRRRRKAAKWGSKKTFKLGSLRIHPIMSKMLLDNWSLQVLEFWGKVWVLNGRLHCLISVCFESFKTIYTLYIYILFSKLNLTDQPRLNLLWMGGLPYSLLALFELVMGSMTQPMYVAWTDSGRIYASDVNIYMFGWFIHQAFKHMRRLDPAGFFLRLSRASRPSLE